MLGIISLANTNIYRETTGRIRVGDAELALVGSQAVVYMSPAPLDSPDGRTKRRQRIEFVESGDTVLVLLLPWLMAYARRRDKEPSSPARLKHFEGG